MNYQTPAAFRMALEARLGTNSREARVDLNRLRRRAVFERVLVRLDDDGEDRWVLKGGMALEVRWRDRARATRDLDLATTLEATGVDDLRLALLDALARDADGDWFQFRLGSSKALSADVAGRPGWRFPLEARLAGRPFAQVSLDVVVRTEEIRGTERLALPGMLAFAGVPTASVEAIDRRQHFAEKLHALTRTYGDRPNTRTRDLVDLAMLIEDGLEPSRHLYEGVAHVFAMRGTQSLPVDLPDPPPDWAEGYATLSADLDLEAKTIDRAMDDLRSFWTLTCSTREV